MHRMIPLWALAAPLMAAAEPRVILTQNVGTNTGQDYGYSSLNDPSASGKTALSHDLIAASDRRYSSYAAGDLSGATLKVETKLPEIYTSGFARGWVTLEDTFTLSAVAPGQIGHLQNLLEGRFARDVPKSPFENADKYSALLRITVGYRNPVTGLSASWESNTVLTDRNSCVGLNYQNQICVNSTAIDVTRSLDIPLQAGNYSVSMSLFVDSYLGWDGQFGHTARAFLDLPDGVTFQSGSGVLFKTAAPIPEPQTWVLMAGGLLLLGSTLARRSRPA